MKVNFITLICKIQMLVSSLLAASFSFIILMWTIIILTQFDPFQNAIMLIAALIVLSSLIAVDAIIISNIRRPSAVTLLFECSIVLVFWIFVSYGVFLGKMYLKDENSVQMLLHHAFRLPEFGYGEVIVTGIALGKYGLLLILLFYCSQIGVITQKSKWQGHF